ncbi:Scr1 family TA system antitoxin-like transcriptional regulator [Streptomyces sp. DH17]|nr:Scr1 family TA system antitoxin-like transcriptional regulator [Streptomyces sp. DH17]
MTSRPDDPVTPVFWALLGEALLHRVVGDRRVMADRLAHVAGLAESGRIRVHVMPRGRGAYPVMQSMLSLMWFEDQPPVAYSEGIQVARIHDSPAVVERLQGACCHALSDAGNEAGSCLEVVDGHPDGIPVRDSKAPLGPALVFSAAGWTSFVRSLKEAPPPSKA